MAKLQPEIRAALLGEAIEGPSIVFASYMVGSVSNEHGRVGKKEAKPEGERSLPLAAVVDLENRLAARIARAAEEGELQSTDEAASMLYMWAHISGDEPVRDSIARSFDRPDFAQWWMRTFTSKGFGQSFGDMVSRRFYSVNRESLETLLDVERLELAARDMMSRGDDPNAVAAHFLEGLNEPF